MLARALVSQGTAERRAGAVSMEETGLAERAPASSQPVQARSFAHRGAACGMMQCGATWLSCMQCASRSRALYANAHAATLSGVLPSAHTVLSRFRAVHVATLSAVPP